MSKLSKQTIKGLVMEVLDERKALVNEGRVTKGDLQRIIKEEYNRLVTEIDAGPDNIPKKSPRSGNVGGAGHSGTIAPDFSSAGESSTKEKLRILINAIFNKYRDEERLSAEESRVLGLSGWPLSGQPITEVDADIKNLLKAHPEYERMITPK